jgi:hypothetical protein
LAVRNCTRDEGGVVLLTLANQDIEHVDAGEKLVSVPTGIRQVTVIALSLTSAGRAKEKELRKVFVGFYTHIARCLLHAFIGFATLVCEASGHAFGLVGNC